MSVDMAALRAYITAKDGHEYDGLAEDTVMLTVTHSNLKQTWPGLRLDRHMTIHALKEKLNKHCGTAVDMMELQMKSDGALVCVLADNTRMLGFYSPANGMTIHIVDHDPTSLSRGGALEDVSLVDKFMLTDDQYDKMENTVRAYKRNKLKEDPNYKFKKLPGASMGGKRPDVESEACIAAINVGDRCIVKPGARRGAVVFTGKVPHLKPGYWVGVRFDEPVGKGDGTAGGKRYFEADPRYGAFARPHNVEVGDFPVQDDLFDSDLDDSDDGVDADGAGAGADEAKASQDEAKTSPDEVEVDAAADALAEVSVAEAAAPAAAAAPPAAAAAPAADADSDDEL